MAQFRHIVVTVVQGALLMLGGTLALELAPRVANSETLVRPPVISAPAQINAGSATAEGRKTLFDPGHCSAMPQRMKASWAPDRANPDHGEHAAQAVSACPRFLSTMSLVRPHHVWRG